MSVRSKLRRGGLFLFKSESTEEEATEPLNHEETQYGADDDAESEKVHDKHRFLMNILLTPLEWISHFCPSVMKPVLRQIRKRPGLSLYCMVLMKIIKYFFILPLIFGAFFRDDGYDSGSSIDDVVRANSINYHFSGKIPFYPQTKASTNVKDISSSSSAKITVSTHDNETSITTDNRNNNLRILHIVTALSEYNNGGRGTIIGQDRLMEVMVPVLVDGVNSMVAVEGWTVDVYLILGYKLRPERRDNVAALLPDGVGLQVWDDATPMGYDRNNFKVIQEITRALARQHRFVIADNLENYDFFSAWEDDMLITASHISHYRKLSHEIEVMMENPPAPWSRAQLERIYPGFFRVEVLTNPSQYREQNKEKIPISSSSSSRVDPSFCCHSLKDNGSIPSSNNLVAWEVGAVGFSMVELPAPIGWVALMPGPKDIQVPKGARIPGYWWHAEHEPGRARPSPNNPQLFGQQGGFMATREQIKSFQEKLCTGPFLPPYTSMRDDGLYMNNVEFWSGGQQLWGSGKDTCALQRIVQMEDLFDKQENDTQKVGEGSTLQTFSRHLLHHTANNKQHTIKPLARVVRIDTLLAQLRTVLTAAKKAKNQGRTK